MPPCLTAGPPAFEFLGTDEEILRRGIFGIVDEINVQVRHRDHLVG
jgi:hypothetical protein